MKRRSKRLDFVERICKFANIIERNETLVYVGYPHEYWVGKVNPHTGELSIDYAKTIRVFVDKVKSGYAIRIKQRYADWGENVGSEVQKVFHPERVKVTQRMYTKMFGCTKTNVLQFNCTHLLW